VIDFRFNEGGFLNAPFRGLGALSKRPTPTIGMDGRGSPLNHFDMKTVLTPNQFILDFDHNSETMSRVRPSFAGPIAVLVGPGGLTGRRPTALAATIPPDRAPVWHAHIDGPRPPSAACIGPESRPRAGLFRKYRRDEPVPRRRAEGFPDSHRVSRGRSGVAP